MVGDIDGTNEAEVHKWFRATDRQHPTTEAENYFAGLMSEAENTTIAEGLHDIVMDYFDDAVDRNGSTELVFRSGSTKSDPARKLDRELHGIPRTRQRVCHTSHTFPPAGRWSRSIRARGFCICLHSTGYFLAHLLFLDELERRPAL